MSIARQHAEWLSLIEVSGPFLSLPVLVKQFPQGLDTHDPEHFRLLRQVHEEWDENQQNHRPDRAIHNQWIEWVLHNTLDLEEVLTAGQDIPQTLKSYLPEHGETLRPDMAVIEPGNGTARLLIQTYPLSQGLSRTVQGRPWKASPDTRMMQLLHDSDVRLGLVTNGDQWMLVDAPKGETTGYASWYSTIWLDEPKTLQAFRDFLGRHRFFGVPDDETLESLLAQSAEDQQEVTDQLGYQVRRAVEVLVQSLDKADRDYGGKLLGHVSEERLYEAALTVMMRLVFLFCAEERELLLLGEEVYDANYAVSTLREQLRTTADTHGEELLERRYDAWSRLLTTVRAVYGGVKHDRLNLPAYGGHLFDPDRFPFLEGRQRDTSWKDTPSEPLPINNRTVLHLLEALQLLQIKLPGGGPAEPRKLSFRALDIEQIGHVYEGLLDHTAKRASEPVLGLSGTRKKEPEIPLAKLEELAARDEQELLKLLKKETGRASVNTIKRLLALKLDDQTISRFRTACQGDEQLWERIKPFAGLVRMDTRDYPLVILPGSVYVTAGTDRRSSGTHYTPRSLTEPIVRYTLEPLVYEGPAEGKDKSDWRLKSAAELLDLNICDMACGSGAFLVQTCRYLSERLLEAWEEAEEQVDGSPRITPTGDVSKGGAGEQLIPLDTEERLIYARRIIAARCLYGVDVNPLAVEMAKLSLWLLTLAKDKPFEFLDHAIRCGDSLVGLHDLEQLRHYSLKPDDDDAVLFKGPLDSAVDEAINLRLKLEDMPSNTVEEVKAQEKLLAEAEGKIARLRCAADMLVAGEFWGENANDKLEKVRHAAVVSAYYVEKGPTADFEHAAAKERRGQTMFHWPLEFPEVIVKRGGFDAFVGNPPFMGGQKITGQLGAPYRDHLVDNLAGGQRGSADLSCYFVVRGASLLRPNGQLGFMATNTLGQGSTRKVSLEALLRVGCSIHRAVASRTWPGNATVYYAIVWIRKGSWRGTFVLDDTVATGITSYLTEPGITTGEPHRLHANADLCFQGTVVLGLGFVLEPAAATRLLEQNTKNGDVIFPYIVGNDVNMHPEQQPARCVINFFDWPLANDAAPAGYDGPVAADYPDCLSILEQTVRPERDAKKNRNTTARDRAKHWWRFGRYGKGLYSTIQKMQRVIVVSLINNHLSFAFAPSTWVFANKLAVYAFDTIQQWGILQSTFHYVWAWRYSSTNLSLMSYSPTYCFETFPFPKDILSGDETCVSSVRNTAQSCLGFRQRLLISQEHGLTTLYNQYHNAEVTSEDIQKLRDHHVEMDWAVAAAYGWDDLDLGHGFHETKQGIRYTISELARREVLQRLLKLNHERYEEEVKQGLHDKKKLKKKDKRKKKPPSSDEDNLF